MSESYSVDGGTTVRLGRMIRTGGEGRIHEVVGVPELVAKALHEVTPNDECRLRALAAISLDAWRRPYDTAIAFAWPVAVLCDASGRVRGVLMPRIDPLAQALTTWARGRSIVQVTRAALAIADRFTRLEQRDVVAADPSPSNFLAHPNGEVSFVDCDSMLPPGPRSRVPAPATPGYAAPETIGDPARRDIYTMRFCLALLESELLTLGTHPFAGRPQGLTPDELEDWSLDYAIVRGVTRFDPDATNLRLPAAAVPPSVLPRPLIDLTRRGLVEGHGAPTARPASAEWTTALADYLNALRPCPNVPAHAFDPSSHADCPWCALADARTAKPKRRRGRRRGRRLALRRARALQPS